MTQNLKKRRFRRRRVARWLLIGAGACSGWMLASMHPASQGQDMFETGGTYAAGPVRLIDGSGLTTACLRDLDPACCWATRANRFEKWDIAQGTVTTAVTLPGPAGRFVLSLDGKTACVACANQVIGVDTAAGKINFEWPVGRPVSALAMSAGDAQKVVVASGNIVRRYTGLGGTPSADVVVDGNVTQVLAGPDELFAVLGDDRKVVALNNPDGSASATWTLDAKPLAAVLNDADHRLLLACDDRQLRVMDTQTGQIVQTQSICAGVTGIVRCPDIGTLFVAGATQIDALHEEDASHYSPLNSIAVPPAAHGLTAGPAGTLLTIFTDDGGKTTLCTFKRHDE